MEVDAGHPSVPCSLRKSQRIANDVEAIRRGIERCLRRFSLEELRIHGGVVLGTASVRAAEGRLVSSGRRITTTTLAAAMAAGIRQPTMDQFEFLRLLVSGYCGNTTWQVHLCSEPLDFDESASMESVACALGEGLSLRCRVIRGPHGAMLAALGPGARAAVMLYFPELRCVLAGWTVDKTKLLSNVANALGFEVIKDCHLSGRHVPSLLRLLESRKGASVLADAEPAEQRPQRTRYGLDFASASHDGPAIVERFAGDAPVLQCLSVTAETSQPDYGMCVKTTAVLSSPDVAASLMDMGKSGLIAPDSVFFTMIERGRNKVTIKFRE